MKKYFEYPFNEQIRNKMVDYYCDIEKSVKSMHGQHNLMKAKVKLERLLKHGAIKKNDVICDVGCSDGALLYSMEDIFVLAVGMDISKPLIERAEKNRELLAQTDTSNEKLTRMSFRHFDGVNIGYENTFDLVTLFDVLEHSFQPDELLKSIWKSLKRNGILAVHVPTTGWLSELVYGKYHMGHLRYYDDKYMRLYIEKFGFEITALDVYNSVPYASKILKLPRLYGFLDKIINAVPAGLYPYFGQVMVLARKT